MIHIVVYWAPMTSDQHIVEELDKNSDYVERVRPGVWLIDTKHTPEQLYRILLTKITDRQTLLIIRITKEYEGWFPQEVVDFLEASNDAQHRDTKESSKNGTQGS